MRAKSCEAVYTGRREYRQESFKIPHISLIPIVVPLKLFLNLVSSPSMDKSYKMHCVYVFRADENVYNSLGLPTSVKSMSQEWLLLDPPLRLEVI